MHEQRGISLILLIIIVVVIGVVIALGFKYAKEYVKEEKTEDMKETMLKVQGVIRNVNNKHTIDKEKNLLIGTKLELDNNETGYQLTEEFKNVLLSIETPELYILTQEDLNNNNVKNVNINEAEFFVVDYNTEEIYYSVGVEGKYKLSELE